MTLDYYANSNYHSSCANKTTTSSSCTMSWTETYYSDSACTKRQGSYAVYAILRKNKGGIYSYFFLLKTS